MKKIILTVTTAFVMAVWCYASDPSSGVMRKEKDGTYIINTTTLCDTKGFRGPVPVEVFIKKGKIEKVVALANDESPQYFAKIKNDLLPQYSGMKISEAKKLARTLKVDACTGATYSCKATQASVAAAIEYYEKNK